MSTAMVWPAVHQGEVDREQELKLKQSVTCWQVGPVEHRGWSRVLPDELGAGQSLPVALEEWLKLVD